ncbi:LamB/YcsF family protein [Aquibacillus salsiterrae]|uniref:5-oxoprolinase subunit A n=1 Tax=Aquibacillus salsiterrae TaxID=2950439 RepID=A0A9X3WBF9_9BACI|nr:5-oxoprolinase subunit PxpA [Aquibacillus salsiterrae]MDC3416097.1 LamB/YcsF family protein [Aquibacillus salsiterrae]
MRTIDINCDMGESFGQYSLGNDEEVIRYVSSVNIACGFHAGDPTTMDRTVKLADKHHVRIGAHPGLPDLQGFGRRNIAILPVEAYQLTLYQVGALKAFTQANGAKLSHVKPHGALYNMAAKDKQLATAIAEAVYQLDPTLTLIGLSNSALTNAGEALGLTVAHEVFADRTYQSDGTLTPRHHPNAVINDEMQAIEQVKQMVLDQRVTSTTGKVIPIQADTVCVHGDNPHTLSFLKKLQDCLQQSGISLTSNK